MVGLSKAANIRALLASVRERLLDLLYPRLQCPLCSGPAGESRDAGICPACLGSLIRNAAADVASRVPAAAGGFACAMHDDALASAIRRFKYGPDEALGEPLGQILAARTAMAVAAGMDIDAVVPVPLHRARLLSRGFNQAAVLAQYVAQRLGVPVRAGWLRRLRRTEVQAGLNRSARLRNMLDAFGADRQVTGARVLLIDDVVTTGATSQACAEALHQAGSIYLVALASAPE